MQDSVHIFKEKFGLIVKYFSNIYLISWRRNNGPIIGKSQIHVGFLGEFTETSRLFTNRSMT